MNIESFKKIQKIGETVAVEFKRCGSGIQSDVYETVCAFLNRFGGDLFLGVEDDGSVCGLPKHAVSGMVKNFISVIGNPDLLSPTVYLVPEIIEIEGKTIIHIHVPPSSEVHSYKKVIFDRVDDADVKITATGQIAAMYIRKQNIFTEKRVYPYIDLEDFRLDLLPRVRQMAINNAGGSHPWGKMSDEELMRSAGFYGVDRAVGTEGYTLAAVMLLGKDDLIQDVSPAYETDALVRKVNVDRYDDREIVGTNLIESFDQLFAFAEKHLPDKFYLEDKSRISVRNIIAREMLVNTLIHREYSSSYVAKFIIEKKRMLVENANRAVGSGFITPENLEPNPKNPTIASFFRNIGLSDRLGSGVRKIFKYSKIYSGGEPEFIDGDVFRIIVPLDDEYSFDMESTTKITQGTTQANEQGHRISLSAIESDKPAIENDKSAIESDEPAIESDKSAIESNKPAIEKVDRNSIILHYLEQNEKGKNSDFAKLLGLSSPRVREILQSLVDENLIEKHGKNRYTYYTIKR